MEVRWEPVKRRELETGQESVGRRELDRRRGLEKGQEPEGRRELGE